uniref:Uncharacterized protein n=1 Tax=Timspurckia oligopyrenoides TaxID=708627 RepID=A0A7S0ZI48_9RHOD|mmetsp:Transcript_6211/g.11077  ORF Transcript_6211/g.11077 Transcript_6211/m.11077 type:complete len:322 (+) Transcript_6211:115-1080(+)
MTSSVTMDSEVAADGTLSKSEVPSFGNIEEKQEEFVEEQQEIVEGKQEVVEQKVEEEVIPNTETTEGVSEMIDGVEVLKVAEEVAVAEQGEGGDVQENGTGDAPVVVAEGMEKSNAEPIAELTQDEMTTLERAKTMRAGPFLVSLSQSMATNNAVKMKKTKDSNTWLIAMSKVDKEGSFELSIGKPSELKKVVALNVSMDLVSLDLFTVTNLTMEKELAKAEPAKESTGKKGFGRSKSGKVPNPTVFTYFLPAIRGYQRHQDAKATPKLPPIQFALPLKVFEGASQTDIFRVSWKAVDQQARILNNKKRFQFLYPPIPYYE